MWHLAHNFLWDGPCSALHQKGPKDVAKPHLMKKTYAISFNVSSFSGTVVASSLGFFLLEARIFSSKSSANCDSSQGMNPTWSESPRRRQRNIRCRDREAGPPTAASKLRSQENPIKIPKEVMRARLGEADSAPRTASSSLEVTPSPAQAVSTRRRPRRTVLCARPLLSGSMRLIISELHVGKLVQHLY